jgi:LysR family glycine cleavage system transcriptional activator
MARRLPPLRALMAVEAVVRHGSVTGAAAELCVTHGAVSKHIAGLEERLGIVLFSNKRRRMVPTDAALTLARSVSAAVVTIGDALDAIQPKPPTDLDVEDLQVIAPATFAMHWLIPRLPSLKRSGFPTRTRVRATHTPEDWRELEWDLAIRSGDGAFPVGLTAVPLFRDTLGLLAAPCLYDDTRRCDPHRLTILESETRPGELDAWLVAANLHRSELGRIELFEHNYIAIEAALAGQGAVVAPLAVVAGQVERGTLVQLRPDVKVQGPLFTALIDPGNPRKARARDLVHRLGAEVDLQALP